MDIITITPTMTEAKWSEAERVRATLFAWFSPAFPIGAFSYSHGLETLLLGAQTGDRAAAGEAIEVALRDGAGFSDAILLTEAFRAVEARDHQAITELAALAEALAPSRERAEEARIQGSAFIDVVSKVWGAEGLELNSEPLPVAVGALGALHRLPLEDLAQAYLSAFLANLVSAAVRLVPLGQTDGQRLQQSLAPVAAEVARLGLAASQEDLGSAAFGLDLSSMRHEDQEVRLFRS